MTKSSFEIPFGFNAKQVKILVKCSCVFSFLSQYTDIIIVKIFRGAKFVFLLRNIDVKDVHQLLFSRIKCEDIFLNRLYISHKHKNTKKTNEFNVG